MHDTYYSETSLCDTGSVVIIVTVQLRDTPTDLMHLLLETLSTVVR